MNAYKILLIERNKAIQEYLFGCLRNHFDLVWSAGGTEEVLNHLSEISFDVIISDGEGFLDSEPTFTRLREWCSHSSKVKLILMRYRSAATDLLQSCWQNPVYFLPKPFPVDDLIGLIKSFSQEKEIERRRDSSQDVLSGTEGEIIMFGKLRHTPPSDLLQFICQMGGAYICSFQTTTTHSKVFIQGNNLVDAHHDAFSGTEAVFKILTLEEGSFALTQTSRPMKRKIFEPVTSLILEGLRRHDEANSKEGNLDDVDFALQEMFR